MTSARTAALRTAIALVAIPFVAAACTAEGEGPSAATGTREPTKEAAGPRSIAIHHAMDTTEVPCSPERIVTLGQGQTDTVLSLGITPVGVVEPWTDDWYGYLPDSVEEAEIVGTELEPDLERVAALEPDLILGSQLRHEAIYDRLSRIAPTVFSETIGMAWYENVMLWARAACREAEGMELLADWTERIRDFQEALGERAATEISMIRFRAEEARIYLTGFPGTVLQHAGLRRPEVQRVDNWVTSEQLITVSQEQIPMMDGDVIFVMVSDEAEGEAFRDRFTGNPLWDRLEAVEAGRVETVNEEHWNLGGGILAANRMLDDLEGYFHDGSG